MEKKPFVTISCNCCYFKCPCSPSQPALISDKSHAETGPAELLTQHGKSDKVGPADPGDQLGIQRKSQGRERLPVWAILSLDPPASQNFAALSFVRVPDTGAKGKERDAYGRTNVCQVVFT